MDQLIADFEKHGYFQQRKICSALRKGLKNGWATWYASIPEVETFIKHSTRQNMSNVTGHDKGAFGHEKPVGVGMSGCLLPAL